MIGQQLYRLTSRDLQITPLEILLFTRSNTSAAAVTITQDYTVPADRILVLHHAVCRGLPAAGGTLTRVDLWAIRNNETYTLETSRFAAVTSFAHGVGRTDNVAPNLIMQISWTGELYLPPQTVLQCSCTFLAAAGNTASLTVAGILIPRGNSSV